MSNHNLDIDSAGGGDLFANDFQAQAAIKNTTGSFSTVGSLSSATGTAASVFCFASLSSVGSPPEPKPTPPPQPQPPTPPPDGGPGLF